jgi:hypothetical protein
MRRTTGLSLIAVGFLLLAPGCSSEEKKPGTTSSFTTETPPPASRDVTISVKNETAEPRVTWVETYHPEKGNMSGQPDSIVQLGTLAPGESVSKTIPVAFKGWYRVIGAKPMEGEKDKVLFMGAFAKIKETGDEPPVRINR